MKAEDIIKQDKCAVDELQGIITKIGKWWDGDGTKTPNVKFTLTADKIDFSVTIYDKALWEKLDLKEAQEITLKKVFYNKGITPTKTYYNIKLGNYPNEKQFVL